MNDEERDIMAEDEEEVADDGDVAGMTEVEEEDEADDFGGSGDAE